MQKKITVFRTINVIVTRGAEDIPRSNWTLLNLTAFTGIQHDAQSKSEATIEGAAWAPAAVPSASAMLAMNFLDMMILSVGWME